MPKSVLPCGHEPDPDILKYHQSFARARMKVKKQFNFKISGLLLNYTCRSCTPATKWRYVPPSEGHWEKIIPPVELSKNPVVQTVTAPGVTVA